MVFTVQVTKDFDDSALDLQFRFLGHQRRERSALEVAAGLDTEVSYPLDIDVQLLKMLSDDILLELIELVGNTMVELRVKFFDDRGEQLTETLIGLVVRC